MNREVRYYITETGESPFLKWLNKLSKFTRAIVVTYIDRVAKGGSLKNIKAVKDGVFEIKIFHNSGLRVYFAEDQDLTVLLLIGGDKST